MMWSYVAAHNVALGGTLVYIREVNSIYARVRKRVTMDCHGENKHSTRKLQYRQKIYAGIYL